MKSILAYSAAAVLVATLLLGMLLITADARDNFLQSVAKIESSGTPFWKSKAQAERGDPTAQYHMGRRYETGDGVPRDLEKARTWYLKAARQGNVWAQNNLGRIYGEGEGVTRNYVTAHMWFVIAAKGGNLIAKSNRKFTDARMTTLEIRKARDMAREWLARHPAPNRPAPTRSVPFAPLVPAPPKG